MKKLLLLLCCSTAVVTQAQNTINITSQQYDILKQANQLDYSKHYNFTDVDFSKPVTRPSKKAIDKSPSAICSCLIPLDATFTVAMAPNDDESSALISLPFNFNFYGTTYTSLYINNNGNISFTAPYGSFTSNPFPDPSFEMIAPFWADVDTRDTSYSGLVYYKIFPTYIVIKWDAVNYYSGLAHIPSAGKTNTFQLIISNGVDPILPPGDNAGFCYGDMQWTTGSVSGGVGGFSGIPSTVGVNKGDGVSYFQVGRFNNGGTVFDGPYGANDSVDWLDNEGMYFDVATVGNFPPVVINNNICDTIDVYTGDTTHLMASFVDSVQFNIGVTTPEDGQTINATLASPTYPANFSYTLSKNTPTYKEFACNFVVAGLPVGLYPINITATDNGTPVSSTVRTVYIRNIYSPPLITNINNSVQSTTIEIYPNPANDNIMVKHNFTTVSNLTLTNILGQVVMSVQLNTQQQSIDISGLHKGIYFATISNKDGKSEIIKFVKK
ncbi:MAG: T9SS type A sorting domain-containing protein [Bacteroidetes bacterium]|nr:T9SS type A sorting domain-containing protein [Bacteroidota bacterium]